MMIPGGNLTCSEKSLYQCHLRRFSHSHEMRLLAVSRPSIRARISAAATGRISVKFGIVYSYENLSKQIQNWLK